MSVKSYQISQILKPDFLFNQIIYLVKKRKKKP